MSQREADRTSRKPMPAPIRSPESQPFWEAAEKGQFLIGACASCKANYWFPRAQCPFCWSTDTSLKPSSGKGVVYTYSIMRRASVPYALAYVTLEEGVTVLTNIVETDLDAIAIGMPVEVVFVPAEDGAAVPAFRMTERQVHHAG